MVAKKTMSEKLPTPQPAEKLIRNLERRQGLIARISKKEAGEFPEIVIKDTLLKFLDKKYKGLGRDEIADLNKRIFALMNRVASLTTKKQDTSPVTAMYAYPYTGARPINEKSYSEFLEEVKIIIALCNQYGISLKSITGMQNGLGIPDTAKLDALMKWHEVNKDKIDLKSITGMQAGLGIPTIDELENLLLVLKK